MSGDRRLKIAGFGAGYFSQFHYDAWSRIDRASLIACADRDPDRAARAGVPAYADLATMLADTRPDIVDIVVPPEGHLAAIRTAAEAGIATIICQKPFCAGLDEATRAAEIAEAAGSRLVVHENFRFQPWYRCIAEAIGAGRVGALQQVTFRLRPGDGQGPEAYLDRQPYFQTMKRFLVHETAVHWIDTFSYLLGPAEAVYADLRRLNPAIAGEDAGLVIFEYAGGLRAVFDGNRHLDHATQNPRLTFGEALVEGTGGTLTMTGDGAVAHRAFGRTGQRELLAAQSWPGFAGDCVFALQAHVVAHVLDGTPLENTARDYLGVLAVEDAIYRSAATGARVVLGPGP